MLGRTVGNERAIRLYTKLGFENEAYEGEEVYVDGAWRRNLIMGLELAPREPKLYTSALHPGPSTNSSSKDIQVRQVMNHDVDELNRLELR
jgi:hypothetical protein